MNAQTNSTEAAPFRAISSDWHRLGAGLSARFHLRSPQRLDVEWLPRLPTKREWKRVDERYCNARNAFAQAVARQTGRDILLVEVL